MYLGDFRTGVTITDQFPTLYSGTLTTLAGTPSLACYKDGSTTESTAGLTLTVDFDGKTGINHISLDTSADGTFYAAGSNFRVVIAAGTVGGASVIGFPVISFSLENRSALMPTTAGRTALVAADGSISPNWADVKSPTTTVALSGTTVGVVTLTNTLTTYTGNTVQTGDSYAVVNSGTHGNAALKTLIDTLDDFVDTEVAAIKTQTDKLVFTVANQLDVNALSWAGAATATNDVALATAPTNFAALAITAAGGVTLADGVTHGGTTAKMRLGSSTSTPALHVTNSDGDAVVFDATAGTGNAFTCHAIYGQGMYLYSETTYGMWCRGWNFGMLLQSNNSNALYIDSDNGAGIFIEAAGHGIDMAITGTNKHGINVTAGTAGVCDAVSLNAGTGGVGLRSDSLTVTGTTTLTGAVTATNASNNVRLGTFTVDINAIAWNAAWDTEVQSECADAITAASLATAANVSAVMTTAMTESYSADGVAPTPAQALFGCLQRLTEFAITGATISVKKLDGTTEAFTLTMDSSTAPTSSTRAT